MERQYLDLLSKITNFGSFHGDRTGTGTNRVFGAQIRFDLREGFPLLTTKKLPFRWIAEELLWFLSGSTNEGHLADKGVNIWKEWATADQCARFGREEGDLGPIYGHLWRNFGATENADGTFKSDGEDQIQTIIRQLLKTPNSRRIILTGWDPREVENVALPPCHTLTQFSVSEGRLSAHLYQRSADMFLGVPFNIASYALLTHLLARATGLEVGDFVHTFGDAHIYTDHRDAVEEQLDRTPRKFPTLKFSDTPPNDGSKPTNFAARRYLFSRKTEHFGVENYQPHPKIKAEVSV